MKENNVFSYYLIFNKKYILYLYYYYYYFSKKKLIHIFYNIKCCFNCYYCLMVRTTVL